jgi:phenylacetate-coenzyme A ligase PaaK-like adenylate-forming protein
VPVEFFVSQMNVQYNTVRSIAQYFLEGRDLTRNRTRLKTGSKQLNKSGFSVKKEDSWLGSLGSFTRSGINKHIEYYHPDLKDLRKELERDAIGYLIAQPRILEMMFQVMEPAVLKRAGMTMWVAVTEPVDTALREIFHTLDIPVRANYSCEEVGIIGAECERFPEHYHIATSNVIVEVSNDDLIDVRDRKLGRVLVTHLHSYGSPLIRYDIGDLGCLSGNCACGYNGPTLSHVFGRSKHLLKHPDGRVSNFSVRSREMTNVTQFEEFRIRQIDTKTIVVEIGGRGFLTEEEIASFVRVVKVRAGDDFDVKVTAVSKIDWGHSIKKLGFSSEVL